MRTPAVAATATAAKPIDSGFQSLGIYACLLSFAAALRRICAPYHRVVFGVRALGSTRSVVSSEHAWDVRSLNV
jgi:hypothetical protein